MIRTETKLAAGVAGVIVVAAAIVWQETEIAKARDGNHALAAGHPAQDSSRARPAPQSIATDASEEAIREREELARLRNEVTSLGTHLQQTRVARAASAAGSPERNRPPLPPGVVSVQDARDVGTATGEALFQTFAWAMRTGDTNRLIQLMEISAESSRAQIETMLRELPKAMAEPEFVRHAAEVGFRAIRQVPLPDGDAAVVMDMYDGGEIKGKRVAMRIRRAGNEWRVVIGNNGPEEVKLNEDLLRD